MNYLKKNNSLIVTLFSLILQTVCNGQNTLLHFRNDVRQLSVEEARKQLASIKRGSTIEDVITAVGYPDEVRVHPESEKIADEWRRWCYGVTKPGELPSVGLVIITTNMTVDYIILPVDARMRHYSTNNTAINIDIECKVNSVIRTNDTKIAELLYIANVCLINSGSNKVEINAEQNTLSQLLQVEVRDATGMLIFARYSHPFWYSVASKDNLRLMPGQREKEDIVVFMRDVEMGIPGPGKYELRVGCPLKEDLILWSASYPFSIGQ